MVLKLPSNVEVVHTVSAAKMKEFDAKHVDKGSNSLSSLIARVCASETGRCHRVNHRVSWKPA
eukprot:994371-Amphidinium_carterae.1